MQYSIGTRQCCPSDNHNLGESNSPYKSALVLQAQVSSTSPFVWFQMDLQSITFLFGQNHDNYTKQFNNEHKRLVI